MHYVSAVDSITPIFNGELLKYASFRFGETNIPYTSLARLIFSLWFFEEYNPTSSNTLVDSISSTVITMRASLDEVGVKESDLKGIIAYYPKDITDLVHIIENCETEFENMIYMFLSMIAFCVIFDMMTDVATITANIVLQSVNRELLFIAQSGYKTART